jgi:hypothetical protein
MGKEADIRADVDGVSGEVRALLERDELILRGEIRRRFPRQGLANLQVADGVLSFTGAGQAVRLHLGDAAPAWYKAITTPPPSLRAKLGLDKGGKALLYGECDDAELAAALDGVVTENGAQAAMLVACITTPEDLAAAEAAQARNPHLPIWAVYPKGRNVTFGDSAIRESLRAHGFRDTKSCAVSERLTATRYHRG